MPIPLLPSPNLIHQVPLFCFIKLKFIHRILKVVIIILYKMCRGRIGFSIQTIEWFNFKMILLTGQLSSSHLPWRRSIAKGGTLPGWGGKRRVSGWRRRCQGRQDLLWAKKKWQSKKKRKEKKKTGMKINCSRFHRPPSVVCRRAPKAPPPTAERNKLDLNS